MNRCFLLTILLELGISGLLPDTSAGAQQQPRPSEVFYAAIGHRVTIQTANGVLSSLEIPKGVFLGVQVIDAHSDTPVRGVHTYRGDIVLRTRRADELGPRERFGTPSERNGSVIMARSQFVLTLEDVVVTVAKVE